MLYLLFLKKRQKLKLSSAANYMWRFMGSVLKKNLSETLSECQAAKIQIRAKILSVLIRFWFDLMLNVPVNCYGHV